MKLLTQFACAALVAGSLLPTTGFAQQTTLHMGHNNQTDHPGHIAGLEFARLVKEGTDGAVEVIVYPAEQLANLRAGAEGVQLGTIDMYYVDSGTLGNWHPQYSFVSLPFMFDDFDHASSSMDSIADEVTEGMRKDFNVERLGWTPAGFRIVLSKDVEVNSASDMEGIKMRVPEIPIYIATFTNIGTNPTPLPWGDVYSALQTGVVDGVEGPASAIRSAGMHEVATHIAPTRHIMTDLSLLMNLDRFNSLSAEHQAVVKEAGHLAFDIMFRELMKEVDDAAYDSIANGLIESSDLDVGTFRTAVQPVVDEFVAGPGEAVSDWIATIRAQ